MAARCFSSVNLRVGAPARPVACRAARETWYPGAEPPAYLDGSMPGDFGFDPLRLGANPDTLAWYQEAELYNGRWAMMATLGICFTDFLGLPKFWEAGAESYAIDFKTLVAVEIVVLGAFEYKRYENIKKTGMGGLLGMAPFDPLGLDSPSMRQKEVKNGRLAMLSFVGYCSQAAVTGNGPVECLKQHLADPNHNNAFTSPVGGELLVATIALTTAPMVVEARKALAGDEEEMFKPIPCFHAVVVQ